jgi:hypothetical protein
VLVQWIHKLGGSHLAQRPPGQHGPAGNTARPPNAHCWHGIERKSIGPQPQGGTQEAPDVRKGAFTSSVTAVAIYTSWLVGVFSSGVTSDSDSFSESGVGKMCNLPEKPSDSDELRLCPVYHGRRRRRVLPWMSPVRTETCEGLTSKRDPTITRCQNARRVSLKRMVGWFKVLAQGQT